MMPRIYAALFLSCLLMAQSASANSDNELDNLLNLLNQQTTLATSTRLNVDFVPGTLSILSAKEMRQKGFVHVWDAIAFLPGVQKSIDSSGMHILTVRGVDQSIGSAKIKLLLNNVMLNTSSSNTVGALLDMPIHQIHSIEFVRGPGSAIHGEFAFAGVINVITKKQGQEFAIAIGSSNSDSLYALLNLNQLHEDMSGSINMSFHETQGNEIHSGLDRTPSSIQSYAPGKINNKRNTLSLIADLKLFDLDFLFQYQQSNRGDYYGARNYLPSSQKQTVISESLSTFSLSKSFDIDDNFTAQWSFSRLTNDAEKNGLFLGVAPVYGGLASDDDIISYVDLHEQRDEFKFNAHYQFQNHQLFSEVSVAKQTLLDYQQFINLDPISGQASAVLNEFETPIEEGQSRTVVSLVLQDEFDLDDSKTITAGLRYDDYDDINNNISPRIAFVWRASQSDIFKMQYAEAFRPPSLLELNGAIDGEIESETINTLDLSFHHVEDDFSLRNTLYFSSINDVIAYQDNVPFGYKNHQSAKIAGLEIEWMSAITDDVKMSTNVTFQQSNKHSDTLKLYQLAPWFVSSSVDYSYSSHININVLMHYSPKIGRSDSDTRADLESSLQADVTLTHKPLMRIKGLRLMASIKNILAQDIRYASVQDSYDNDYLYNDATSIWLELTYHYE